MSTYAVVIAGGPGTRLWPLSRRGAPKHILRLAGRRSLFRETLERLRPITAADFTLVVTVPEQADLLRGEAPEIPEANFLIEPVARGTAGAIGWAAAEIARREADGIMACLPADHVVRDSQEFAAVLRSAVQAAAQGHLVTLGIEPSYPATGYGYLELGPPAGDFAGRAGYSVRSFREKPDESTARGYVESGSYLWNSGMFVWRAGRILEEIGRLMPDLAAVLQRIRGGATAADSAAVVAQEWPHLRAQTIDYGIMEGARGVVVIPAARIGWLDVGNWERLFEVGTADDNGNLIIGENVELADTEGTLVYRAGPTAAGLIATMGLRDLIIVDAGDALLICPRSRAEDVRRLVDQIERSGGRAFL